MMTRSADLETYRAVLMFRFPLFTYRAPILLSLHLRCCIAPSPGLATRPRQPPFAALAITTQAAHVPVLHQRESPVPVTTILGVAHRA